MNMSPSIGNIAAAIAKMQGETTSPKKDREVTVTSKKEGVRPYTFKYATLDSILDAIRKPLSKNELCVVQSVRAGERHPELITTVAHSSGEWMSETTPIIGDFSSPQSFGSAITYAKRYAITAMFCLCADEDDDGNGAAGNHADFTPKNQKAAPKPKEQPQPTPHEPQPAKTGDKKLEIFLTTGEIITVHGVIDYIRQLRSEVEIDPGLWQMKENEDLRKRLIFANPKIEDQFRAIEASFGDDKFDI